MATFKARQCIYKIAGKEGLWYGYYQENITPIMQGHVYESQKQYDMLFRALSRTKYAYEHGLACPADRKYALKVIAGLETFEIEEAMQ